MQPSPFPGMDPYLEARWNDVHLGLCSCLRAALQPLLPPGLRAAGEQDVQVQGEDDDADGTDDEQASADGQRWSPDVAVIESGRPTVRAAGGVAAATAAPLLVRAVPAPRRVRRWVQIVDAGNGNRVVTAIEVLSPANKTAGRINRDYRRKLRDYMAGRVNVVELDLLRSGRRRLAVPAVAGPREPGEERPATTYYTCVHRATRRRYWEVYPMPLRSQLPTVAVPCRRTDADVPLDLQALIDRVYREGGHYDIDYRLPPDPPLPAADVAWAADRLAQWSAR